MSEQVFIQNIPKISAIYFAMLQCEYDFYMLEKDEKLIEILKKFRVLEEAFPFFKGIKQNTCEIYPYWPRAAILETASFFINSECTAFENFETFRKYIMSADNISDTERNEGLWEWIKEFPNSLKQVLHSECFLDYLIWENEWIQQQNLVRCDALKAVQRCLDICIERYKSPVQKIIIVLNPIKCVYSADYHMLGNCFVFCSGKFRAEAVVHEFLHHVLHSVVKENEEEILRIKICYPEINDSYYLTNDDRGWLNAFEEYSVRLLTKEVIAGNAPESLEEFLHKILDGLR